MPDTINEREFELINIIGAKLPANQRDLSKQLDISLGTTNLLLRRLIAKGYIRILQLNKKKAQYLLTPKGFAEKYRKSVNYTLKTIRSIGFIRRQVETVIQRLYAQGHRNFFILGNSDLVELVEMCLKQPQWLGVKFTHGEQIPANFEGIILICREKSDVPQPMPGCSIDLIEELAKAEELT